MKSKCSLHMKGLQRIDCEYDCTMTSQTCQPVTVFRKRSLIGLIAMQAHKDSPVPSCGEMFSRALRDRRLTERPGRE